MGLTDFMQEMFQNELLQKSNAMDKIKEKYKMKVASMDSNFFSSLINKYKTADIIFNDNRIKETEFYARKAFLEIEIENARCEFYNKIIKEPENEEKILRELQKTIDECQLEIDIMRTYIFGKQIKMG